MFPTTLYVAVARARKADGQESLRITLENDLRVSLADGLISMDEYLARMEKLQVREDLLTFDGPYAHNVCSGRYERVYRNDRCEFASRSRIRIFEMT